MHTAVDVQDKRLVFLYCFFFIRQRKSRLDIQFFLSVICYKINFPCDLLWFSVVILFARIHHSHIYHTVTDNQLIIYDIFHYVRHFLLSEAYPCISQPYILAIIFVRVIKITFTSDIIPPALTEKICVGQIINILLYRIISDSTFALQLLL